jgi:hypothetical protein
MFDSKLYQKRLPMGTGHMRTISWTRIRVCDECGRDACIKHTSPVPYIPRPPPPFPLPYPVCRPAMDLNAAGSRPKSKYNNRLGVGWVLRGRERGEKRERTGRLTTRLPEAGGEEISRFWLDACPSALDEAINASRSCYLRRGDMALLQPVSRLYYYPCSKGTCNGYSRVLSITMST